MSPASRGATSQKKKPLTDNKTLRRNSPGAMTQKAVLGKRPTKSPQEQPETSVLKPPGNLVIEKISPNLMSALESANLRESPSSPMSPLYKSFPPFSRAEESAEELEVEDKPTGKQRASKSDCPCRSTSEGKEWKFKCTRCLQHWHASCCNLKGANKIQHDTPLEASLNVILSEWLCPWCFDTSFPRPGSSMSAKMDNTLKSSVDYSQNIQAISDAISNAVGNSMPTVEITSLETRLKKLSQEIHEFQQSRTPSEAPPAAVIPLPKCTEPPVCDYQVNVLSADILKEVTEFLMESQASNKFTQKNGRQVLKFGEDYSYTGDSDPPLSPTIPTPLASAIDAVTSKCRLTHKPNSILINYYPPSVDSTTSSKLPFHSDDESEIISNSEIVTISIGDVRKVCFKCIHETGNEASTEYVHSVSPESNSVYVMTRSSQAWYHHGIDETGPADDQSPVQTGRFSITLRTVSKQFSRSCIIMGDSNTKPIKFGVGTGTLGQSFPGERVKANKVSVIDPKLCIGYSNVILVCGTNDLRVENVQSPGDIHQLVDILHLKIQQIQKLCPKAKIFVTAVLPSRLPKMNNNIMTFNSLVDEMLYSSFNQTVWHLGVGHFLDSKGLLAMKLTRKGDEIHLGELGICKFVRCLKQWVYVRERQERVRQRKATRPVGVYPT